MTTIWWVVGLLSLTGLGMWWLGRDAQKALTPEELIALLMLLSLQDE